MAAELWTEIWRFLTTACDAATFHDMTHIFECGHSSRNRTCRSPADDCTVDTRTSMASGCRRQVHLKPRHLIRQFPAQNNQARLRRRERNDPVPDCQQLFETWRFCTRGMSAILPSSPFELFHFVNVPPLCSISRGHSAAPESLSRDLQVVTRSFPRGYHACRTCRGCWTLSSI